MAATSSATLLSNCSKKPEIDPAKKGIHKIPTYCDVCFWACNAVATVEDGKLKKIEGNTLDPLSQGRLCPRGTGGIGAHFDKDRLTHPLMRVGEKGEEKWKKVSWDEALTFIAKKLNKIKAEHGPEAVALYSHGAGGSFFKHTMHAYGTHNIAAPSYSQCRGPREIGFVLTVGDEVSAHERTDIENAKTLVLIGSHLGENMHNSQVHEFANTVSNGCHVIVVDPRYSVAAGKAKDYLPIKPGTDMALVLAWMNVLITEGLYDKEYVAKYGFGFEAFAAEMMQYTPEWAFPKTGIEPDVIRKTARQMASTAPATLVHPGRHVTWNGDDTQRSRAIALLNSLLGSWGRKGGFYTHADKMEVPKYPYTTKYPHSDKPKADRPNPTDFPFANGAHDTLSVGIRDATITGKPYPIKAWVTYGTNLLNCLPDTRQTIEAIKKLDLLVVCDIIPSELAGWADVVLPESTYLERHDDLVVKSFRDQPYVGIRQPVVESPDDQKPNWWIARELAFKLGLGEFYPWKTIEEYLETRMKLAKLDWKKLQKEGMILGEKGPIYMQEEGNDDPQAQVEMLFCEDTDKINFYSNALKEKGFDPVPKYTAPDPLPGGSFHLLFGRAPMHTFGKTQTNPLLHDMMSENEVWINAAIARQYDIKSGDYIKLKNQDGVTSNFPIKAKVTNRIRKDCVFVVHGFGHSARGMGKAYGKGASDNHLITKYKTDPLMGGTGMNVNFVTLETGE